MGRIVKTGSLETAHIISALRNAQSITRRNIGWTLVDVQELVDGRTPYIFGRLTKYDPKAEVSIMDPARRIEIKQQEPNLIQAYSPFVYIPEYSGISFLHVSNHIDYTSFMRRWSDVINASHGQILAQCDVEAITDLRSFSIRLRSLEGIYKMSSTVSPPNPMFGPLWKNLKDYLGDRNAARMKVEENSEGGKPLKTCLADHVEGILNQTADRPYETQPLPVGDAAVLMAADGYGQGYVRGKLHDEFVTVRTSETVQNFQLERKPDPEVLYRKTAEALQRVQEERQMEH